MDGTLLTKRKVRRRRPRRIPERETNYREPAPVPVMRADTQKPTYLSLLRTLPGAVLTVAAITWTVWLCWDLACVRVADIWFNPINGDFQSFNPVRRLFAGQAFGRDFDAYLGVGPTYLTYFAMWIFGSDFTGSLLASHFLNSMLHFLLMTLLCRWCGTSRGLAVQWGALATTMMIPGGFLQIDKTWGADLRSIQDQLFQPGGSALGLRCAAPLFAAIALSWIIGNKTARPSGPSMWRATLALGIVGGIVALWSNDYGLVTIAALTFVFASCVFNPRAAHGFPWPVVVTSARPIVRRVIGICTFLTIAALSAVTVLTFITRGHPWSWVEFNFGGVARDQFWYFLGPKVLTVKDLAFYPVAWCGAVCALLLWAKTQSRFARPHDAPLLLVVLALLAGGCLSSLGHSYYRYFFPLYRCLFVVVPYLALCACCLFPWYVRPVRRIWERLAVTWRRWQFVPLQIVAVALFSGTVLLGNQYRIDRQNPKPPHPNPTLHVAELGGPLPHWFEKMVAIGREIRAEADQQSVPAERRVFSTYSTALDVLAGAFHPTRDDYLIHALGPQRRADYLHTFHETRPMYVTTIRESFVFWEKWLRRSNWDFYRELIRHYEPIEQTPYNIVWAPRKKPLTVGQASVDCTIDQVKENEVSISFRMAADSSSAFPPAPTGPQIVDVEIDYANALKPGSRGQGVMRQYLVVTDPTVRDVHGALLPFGLPLYANCWRFPVELEPGQSKTVRLELQPGEASKLTVHRCTATPLIAKNDIDEFPLRRFRAVWWNDVHWKNGISISPTRTGFFVSDLSDLRGLRPGTKLLFAGSGVRTVEAVEPANVWVSGPRLDPETDGYPHLIQVLDDERDAPDSAR